MRRDEREIKLRPLERLEAIGKYSDRTSGHLKQKALAQRVACRIDRYTARSAATILLVCGLQALVLGDAHAASDFGNVCPDYLTKANDFVQECRENARLWTAAFRPAGAWAAEPVSNSIYFSPNVESSHFGLGCSLRPDKTISFVGVYYSLVKRNFSDLNGMAITFLDLNGVAGFRSGNSRFVVWPVRPFVTSKIPSHFRYHIDFNCWEPTTDTSPVELPGLGPYAFSSTVYRDSIEIKSCHYSHCSEAAYEGVFFQGLSGVIFHFGSIILIRYTGEIDIQEPLLMKFCIVARKVPNNWVSGLGDDLCRLIDK